MDNGGEGDVSLQAVALAAGAEAAFGASAEAADFAGGGVVADEDAAVDHDAAGDAFLETEVEGVFWVVGFCRVGEPGVAEQLATAVVGDGDRQFEAISEVGSDGDVFPAGEVDGEDAGFGFGIDKTWNGDAGTDQSDGGGGGESGEAGGGFFENDVGFCFGWERGYLEVLDRAVEIDIGGVDSRGFDESGGDVEFFFVEADR